MRIIDVRDERAAIHMAQAHAELTGHPGVAMVTAGPGMTNAVTGIANAHISRVPLLVISGRPPRPQEFMGALQDLPQVEIIKPITRYARSIQPANHVLRELDEALACAAGQGNEPGPAFIDFPTDLLREKIPVPLVDKDRFQSREVFYPDPPPEAVNRVLDILWSARRPVMISGRGARGAGRSITRLLDKLGCVYLDTAESRGLVPYDHPACDFFYGYDAYNESHYFFVGRTGGLIQDFGYTESLDEITYAPEYGWSPTGVVEAILGHTYVFWTWDNHFAKFRVTEIGDDFLTFDWAYQIDPGNPELVIRP